MGAGRSDLRVNGEPRKDQRSYLADSYPVVWMGNDDLPWCRPARTPAGNTWTFWAASGIQATDWPCSATAGR
ncbi:MAG: hypothetical protein ACLRPT_01335 [Akkermansia muciniphila]